MVAQFCYSLCPFSVSFSSATPSPPAPGSVPTVTQQVHTDSAEHPFGTKLSLSCPETKASCLLTEMAVMSAGARRDVEPRGQGWGDQEGRPAQRAGLGQPAVALV